MNTVKGYAAHESQTFEKVTQARNAAISVPPGDVQGAAKANQALGGALRGLLAIAESYPDLKANQNFLELQSALQSIEGDLGMRAVIIMQLSEITIPLFNNFRE